MQNAINYFHLFPSATKLKRPLEKCNAIFQNPGAFINFWSLYIWTPNINLISQHTIGTKFGEQLFIQLQKWQEEGEERRSTVEICWGGGLSTAVRFRRGDKWRWLLFQDWLTLYLHYFLLGLVRDRRNFLDWFRMCLRYREQFGWRWKFLMFHFQ